jgi:zinc-ribbon domain
MSGLMRRLTRGRAATDDEATPPERGASDPVGDAGTEPTPDGVAPEAATIVVAPEAAATEGDPVAPGGTTEVAAEPAADDLPAGLDAGELATAPAGIARRSRVRRRLRYLLHARELLLRDLGGFYYEAHRSAEGAEAHRRLLDVKARRLAMLDAEMRELEERLGEPHAQAVLREPAIGGTCPHCGELHGSDARFCPRCGNPLTARGRRPEAAAAAAQPYEELGRPTTASLWGRRRTPQAPATAEATQATGGDATAAVEPGRADAAPEEAPRAEAGSEPERAEAAPDEAPRGNGTAAHPESSSDGTSVGATDPTAEPRP